LTAGIGARAGDGGIGIAFQLWTATKATANERYRKETEQSMPAGDDSR
jgi:hypothetical protein